MKDSANNTKQALDVSEKAIKKAKTALKDAHNNLNSTRNATAEVQAGYMNQLPVEHFILSHYIIPYLSIFHLNS